MRAILLLAYLYSPVSLGHLMLIRTVSILAPWTAARYVPRGGSRHAFSPKLRRGAAQPASCEASAARQFDFWVGTWTLRWGEDGYGTNVIERILGGCVIEENFVGRMPDGLFRGKSVSVYDARQQQWKQTWVDDRGGYLDFTGGFEEGRMVLQRETVRDGKPLLQRMVWYNISADELDWNWEKSEDGGETWTTLWKIHYTRKK